MFLIITVKYTIQDKFGQAIQIPSGPLFGYGLCLSQPYFSLNILLAGGYIKTQERKTKEILSDRIVRFRGVFFVFAGIFPVFGVVTLLPGHLVLKPPTKTKRSEI